MPHYLYNCRACGKTEEYVLPMPKKKEAVKPAECFKCGAPPSELERKFAGQTISVGGNTNSEGIPKGYDNPFVQGTEEAVSLKTKGGAIVSGVMGIPREDVQVISSGVITGRNSEGIPFVTEGFNQFVRKN
jgi:predicted nucleic acid-binding Zn ribbon protein